jgi:hypothetical protein
VLQPLYVWQENFPKESPASLIIKHQDYGNIMLCGDFNARVGCENDFITKDNNNFNPSFDCYVSCHTYNGSSTVDYVIVSEPLLFEIPLFNIANFILH